MGGRGFVLFRYFNKFACKVGYLVVTQKVIALIFLTESRLFLAVKGLSVLSQAILWLTNFCLLGSSLISCSDLDSFLLSFFFWDLFIGDFECTNNNIQANIFWNKKRPMSVSSVSVCPRSLNKRLQKHRENHLRYIWRMWIHSVVGCPLRQGWYQLKILLEEVLNHLVLFLLAKIFNRKSVGDLFVLCPSSLSFPPTSNTNYKIKVGIYHISQSRRNSYAQLLIAWFNDSMHWT